MAMFDYKTKINFEEVKAYIEANPNSKLYIGCDSERVIVKDVWYADYASVIVVHIGGRHGCKVFGQIERERDYDQNKGRPRMRLMNEVMKVAELYINLGKTLGEDFECDVHLDINPNELYGSSCVVQEAVGYIRGMCNVIPLVKPQAWAATHCADRLKELRA
jgi:predicted RNase H-related nuclease YkuK (DUF458 family)